MTAATPGTYAIAVSYIGGAQSDGTPTAFTQSAVCDVCGNWATEVCTAGRRTTTNDDILNQRISRRIVVIAYACPEHYDGILNNLCQEFGAASNRYDPDELADEVDRYSRMRFSEDHQ